MTIAQIPRKKLAVRTGLYTIAIMPPTAITHRLIQIEQMLLPASGNVKMRASMPIIPLIRSFKMPLSRASIVASALGESVKKLNAFEVNLNKMEWSEHNALIVKASPDKALKGLKKDLKAFMIRRLNFPENFFRSQPYSLKMYQRNIPKRKANEIAKRLESFEFDETFEVGSVFLLRHNYYRWEVFKEFKLDSSKIHRKELTLF